jgi:hypothetical protein
MVAIIEYNYSIKNYKGFAVAAISGGLKDNGWTKSRSDCISILPSHIDYDEYVGVVAIINNSTSPDKAYSQLRAYF